MENPQGYFWNKLGSDWLRGFGLSLIGGEVSASDWLMTGNPQNLILVTRLVVGNTCDEHHSTLRH